MQYNNTSNNINSNINAPLKYKKYNFYEIDKELNNEQDQKNNTSNFYENNNSINSNSNLLRFNSYRDIHNNASFHNNLNNELEKNKLKIENEKLIKENILIKKELNNALNQIDKIKEQPLLINVNKINNNNELKDYLSLLNNKIAIYEISLEKTKNQYEKQINYYIQQLSNYNNLILIVNSFFQNISKKFITDYNFNIQNNFLDPTNYIPFNQSDLEEKFKKIEDYIYNLNNEINIYKNQKKSIESPIPYNNLKEQKLEINDNYYLTRETNNDEEENNKNNNSSFIKNNNYFNNNNIIFENEIIAKKIRSNSSTGMGGIFTKKENQRHLNSSSNKRNKKEKSKDSQNRINKSNLDIMKYKNKKYKKIKSSNDIPIRGKKRSKSKNKNKNKK